MLEVLTDKDGNKFELIDEVWLHIRTFHPEIKNIRMIEEVLKEPDIIAKSNWDEESELYYKKIGHLFRTVVVQKKENRIKTTLTTDKVKKGTVLWKKE